MSKKAASSAPFNCLTRYHSAPGSFMCNRGSGEGDLPQLQGSSYPSARADAILTSLFSDDLTAWTQQQNGAGGPVHMLHQFPILDEHSHFMAGQLDPSKPTSETEKSRPGKPSHGLASLSREAGLYQFAALGYTSMISGDGVASYHVPKNKWKLHEDEGNGCMVLAQPQVSKGLIRASSLQQSSSPAQFLKCFSSGMQAPAPEGCEGQGKGSTSGRASHAPEPVARNLAGDLSETLDPPTIELNGCGEVENEKYSTLDNFSSVTGTSPPTFKKRFRSLTTDSSSSDILLDGEPQEQTCISLPKQELLPSNLTPCQSRAKRGHATHPRSIAERVRRTRISERIKKLQDLVPNMDKQINTADMLDEVVEYVKQLQRQVQELSKDHPPKVN